MKVVVGFDGARCTDFCVWCTSNAISSQSCSWQPAPLLARPQTRQTAVVSLHHWQRLIVSLSVRSDWSNAGSGGRRQERTETGTSERARNTTRHAAKSSLQPTILDALYLAQRLQV